MNRERARRSRRRALGWIGAILAALGPPVPTADATVLVPADVETLVAEAQTIAHGRVADVRAQWTPGRRRIERLVTLQVDDLYKGAAGATLTVRVPGGTLGRYRTVLVGAPEFAVGDEVVLFLGARPPGLPYILGLSQGVFRVGRDEAGAAQVISPVLSRTTPGRVVRGDERRRPMPLAEFAARVAALVEGDKSRVVEQGERP